MPLPRKDDENELTVVVVVRCRLNEEEILLEIVATEKLACPDDELIAFLERPSADETAETRQMKGQRRAGPHHQLVRIQPFSATSAFGAVHPSSRRTIASFSKNFHRKMGYLS